VVLFENVQVNMDNRAGPECKSEKTVSSKAKQKEGMELEPKIFTIGNIC